MADVSERRVRPIQEAVEGKHWKQALQLCEKWQKKGEKSDRFQATRAYVLAKQHDPALAKIGRDEITQLCYRTPAVSNLATIHRIQAALTELGIGDDGGRKLWERAAAAKPDDKEIAMAWLDEAIDRCDWRSAQKATMALRKSSPKNQKYEFWTVFMCYLIYKDPFIPAKEKDLFGTLAYRMLSKAAEAVPLASQQSPGNENAIQSPEELSLLVRVYIDTGHLREAKDVLVGNTILGPQSAVHNLDHDLHGSLLLEVLQLSQDWQAIVDRLQVATQSLTEQLQVGKTLRILLDACEEKADLNILQKLRDCLQDGLKILPHSRDLHYGMLRVHQIERAKEDGAGEVLMDACKQYFSLRCEQLSCFDELRGSVRVLDPESQQNFMDWVLATVKIDLVSEALSVVQVLNALKLEYCFLTSREPAERTTQDFSVKIVNTYRHFCCTDKKSNNPVIQLAMLACMALLRVNKNSQGSTTDRTFQPTSYVQACFLLSYCSGRCKDDYPTLVVLILTSTLLGLTSLAATSFRKLSIKNVQWENAGYLFLTRSSTFHPHRSKGSEKFDPLQMLDLAMAANTNSVRSTRRHIMAGLDHKSYVNVLGTIQLKEDLKRSFTRQLYYLESARAKRLRDLPTAEQEPAISGSFVDRRDFSFIPSFEDPGVKLFAQHLEAGPKPKDGWLRIMTICNTVLDLIYDEYHQPLSINRNDVQELHSALNEAPSLLKTTFAEFTDAEVNNCSLQFCLGKALTSRLRQTFPTASPESNGAIFGDAVQQVQDWLNDTARESTERSLDYGVIYMAGIPIAPSWEYLHLAFSTLESLQAISLFLAGQGKASETKSGNKKAFVLPTEQWTRMRDMVSRIEKSIHDSARTLKENLNTPGGLGHMIDMVFGRSADSTANGIDAGLAAFGRELEKLPDAETAAEMFCAEARESWGDALDGVLSVAVKKYK